MKNTRAQAKVAPAAENVSAEVLLEAMRNVLEENDRLHSENDRLRSEVALYQRLQAEFDQLQAEVQASAQQKGADAVVGLVEKQLWSQGDLSLLQDLVTPQPNGPGRGNRSLTLYDHAPAIAPPRPVLTGEAPNPPPPRPKKRTRSRSCASAASGAEDSAYSTDEDKRETRSTKTRRCKKQA